MGFLQKKDRDTLQYVRIDFDEPSNKGVISMEHIIHQMALNLAKKLMEIFKSDQKIGLDAWTSAALEESKKFSIQVVERAIQHKNEEIRANKSQRKEWGLVLKEKERPRSILTELGMVHIARDYYYDKQQACYVTPLDTLLKIRPYERIGDEVSARLVREATDMSYAQSARVVTNGQVSRQSVRNCILRCHLPERKEVEEKRKVSVLHIYADEDHVHLQKEEKKRGKENQIVPLVTVTEGTESGGGRRHRTLEKKHFVSETFQGEEVWKEVDQYIQAKYDTSNLEKLYVHADGGKWIESGLEEYPQRAQVMDGYHLEKYLQTLSQWYPKHSVRKKLGEYIQRNEKEAAKKYCEQLEAKSPDKKIKKKTIQIKKYLWNHWEKIVRRRTEEIPGSCTEGQVSHVLSERFSRHPMGWSKKVLGQLSKLRVHVKNGEEIKAEYFQGTKEKEPREELQWEKKLDWSVFEKEAWNFQQGNGTQEWIHSIGKYKDIFMN